MKNNMEIILVGTAGASRSSRLGVYAFRRLDPLPGSAGLFTWERRTITHFNQYVAVNRTWK